MCNITICLTGVTGLLGRNILFEYLKLYQNNLQRLELILFGRDKSNFRLKSRVKEVFLEDGIYYLDIKDNEKVEKYLIFLEKCVTYIHLNLESHDLELSSDSRTILQKKHIDIFFHVGAYTSFSTSKIVRDKVLKINTYGTQKLLEFLKGINIKRLCYISSAYATGLVQEKVDPNDISLERQYRNPYEFSKLKAEHIVRDFENVTKVPVYIFRTSILAGRLLEKKLGQIHKFDVFYGWTQFFIKIKMAILQSNLNIYDTPVDLNMRIFGSLQTTLNIIPSDFAAKSVVYIMSKQHIRNSSFHLTSSYETTFIEPILSFLNIQGYTFVNAIPDNQNKYERLYYRSVGKLFYGYMQNKGRLLFDNSSLLDCLDQAVVCPPVNRSNLLTLLQFAKSKNFGLS